jgi:hypothetical protein
MMYNIQLHQHRFSAWAAARAASVKGKRFTVKTCVGWLEAFGFGPSLTIEMLPLPENVDSKHREWREQLIAEAKLQSAFELSHGQAAKIINCYIKARFLNPHDAEKERLAAFHPPIDRLLLNEIVKHAGLSGEDLKIVRSGRNIGWSSLNSQQYEALVGILRRLSPSQPFWRIEEFWPGYQ